jgi:hypothetical protein
MSQLQVTGEAKVRDIQGPVVANSGVITALDGAASQYVRGDGTLADFPTSSGGGSSVSYYLNSSVSQGTIGGIAYRELSKEPIIGAGTDIAISANGYVANYITDANDPDVVLIPGGNFNCEFYFSVNNNTGNPFAYAELYKYDGSTFTLLGTSVGVPEYINQGTVINPYYFAIPVATAALALTDRLAIRIYVNVDGRTVTLHTENGHLCQVVTTLSKGMVSLNNLTDQSQFITTGTSGTNFAIVSSGDTHTFNLPVASASNTGKLSSTDWSTFNGKVPYTGANASVDLGIYNLSASLIDPKQIIVKKDTILGGSISIETGSGFSWFGSNDTILLASGASNTLSLRSIVSSVLRTAILDFSTISAATSRTFTLPDASGQIAILESPLQVFTGTVQIQGQLNTLYGITMQKGSTPPSFSFGDVFIYAASGSANILKIANNTYESTLSFPTSNQTYTYPAASGTIALTSNLSSYVPYTGATGAVNLGAFDLTVNGLTVGKGGGSVAFNTAIGISALAANTTGTYNTSIGESTLSTQTTANNNTAIGSAALAANTSGTPNTAIGRLSLATNTTGGSNTAIGYQSLYLNTSGSNNTAIGVSALAGNTTGYSNTAVGQGALLVNTTGYNNVGLGQAALSSNTTGAQNIAIGVAALANNTTASNNLVIGHGAMSSNNTGSGNIAIGTSTLASNTTASNNTAVGYDSLSANTTGSANTSLGLQSLKANTIGSSNTAIGTASLLTNTTGSNNTGIGNAALSLNTTGTGNTAIGQSAGFSITTGSNNTIIGSYAGTAAMSNNIVLADGAGNIRYQWNGTNNVFGNPISGTSATFSNILTVNTNDQSISRLVLTNTGTGGQSVNLVAGNPNIDNTGFSIAYGNTNFLRFNTTGNATFINNVGIGATSPVVKLQITQPFGTTTPTLGTSSGGLFVAGDTNLYGLYIGNDSVSGNAWIQSMRNNTATAYSILLNPVGGNVGIGTSSPSNILTVQANDTFNQDSSGQIVIKGASNTAKRLGIGFDTTNNYGYVQAIEAGVSTRPFVLQPFGGNVGIGITSPSTKLSVSGTGNVVSITSSDNSLSLALGYQGTMHGYLGGFSSRLEGYSNNGGYVFLNASSVWVPASDIKRKRNFETYSLGLDAILGLKPKRYNMDFQADGDEKQVGLVAQEVKEHIPQAFEQSEDFIGINYNVIIVTLVNAIQELKAEIDELKNR